MAAFLTVQLPIVFFFFSRKYNHSFSISLLSGQWKQKALSQCMRSLSFTTSVCSERQTVVSVIEIEKNPKQLAKSFISLSFFFVLCGCCWYNGRMIINNAEEKQKLSSIHIPMRLLLEMFAHKIRLPSFPSGVSNKNRIFGCQL